MRSSCVAMIVTAWLGIGTVGATAQSPQPSLEAGWERVEVAADGFAIGLPPGWDIDAVAVIETEMRDSAELLDEAFRALETDLTDWPPASSTLRFSASDPQGDDCGVYAYPSDGLGVERLAARDLAEAEAESRLFPELSVAGPELTVLQLPAGTAGKIKQAWDFGDGVYHFVDYTLADGTTQFTVACVSEAPRDDDWLSMAETFEFLPIAAQDSNDIEFHALFPGRQSGDGLDCSAGEAAYAPLRAGRTLQLTDDTGAVVGSGVLADVVPPSREAMCETSVTFAGIPDVAAYSVRAGDQAIASRDKAELEASGWVMRSMFGTRSEPTPVPTQAAEPATNTGPVVLGGRIEVPSAGFALEVPEGWYAFDLSAPDLIAEMEAFDRTTAMLAPNIGAFGVTPEHAAEFPLFRAPLVALAPFERPTAGETCSVLVEPVDSDSLDVFAAALLLEYQEGMDGTDDLVPVYIDLPAGGAAMLEPAGVSPLGLEVEMTAFGLLHDGWGYTLQCGGLARQTDRWLSIAETFEFLSESAED